MIEVWTLRQPLLPFKLKLYKDWMVASKIGAFRGKMVLVRIFHREYRIFVGWQI